MEDQKRAERVLRKKLGRDNRTFGDCSTPRISEVEFIDYCEGLKLHEYCVKFVDGQIRFYEVRLYSKSAKVWRT